MRKRLFPPRPRGHRKRRQRKASKQSRQLQMSVQQEVTESAADSGIGSQESTLSFPSCSSQIDMPSSLGSPCPSSSKSQDVCTYNLNIASTSSPPGGIKRKNSNELDDEASGNSKRIKVEDRSICDEIKATPQIEETSVNVGKSEDEQALVAFVKPADVNNKPDEAKEEDVSLCIMCQTETQNSVFVHSSFGCLCCCYKCAMKSWATYKQCPVCTRKVKNIIRIYKS